MAAVYMTQGKRHIGSGRRKKSCGRRARTVGQLAIHAVLASDSPVVTRCLATYAASSDCFLGCSACLAAARFTALGPLFFFFRRAAARSDLESFGAGGMPPSIPLV